MQKETINGFRLSPQQRHLWLLQEPTECQPYQVRCAVMLDGRLDAPALERALRLVVERHEILRTSFHSLPGMLIPLQVINEPTPPSFARRDLTALSPREQQAETEELLRELGRRPFDFEQHAPLQLALLRLSPSRHALLLRLPAVCADAAASENLVRELSECYAACLRDEPLSDEPMQYADISEWQNELLESDEAGPGRAYWQEQNVLDPLSIPLPLERQPEAGTAFAPDSLARAVEPEVAAAVEACARRYNTSSAVILMACWQVWLWRLTGQTDVVVGSRFDGRNYPELEGALGLLAKHLPVQAHLAAGLRFGEVLQQVVQTTRAVADWQESFSLAQLAAAHEHSKHEPFFPLCFEFEEGTGSYDAGGLTFTTALRHACVDRFKLKLACAERNEQLFTEWHYDANLFQTADVERWAAGFQVLLQSACADPSTP
ncbi:MAG TPA: condensation domain-containing protein, partial [Pyrinomonadaceae bacterium]